MKINTKQSNHLSKDHRRKSPLFLVAKKNVVNIFEISLKPHPFLAGNCIETEKFLITQVTASISVIKFTLLQKENTGLHNFILINFALIKPVLISLKLQHYFCHFLNQGPKIS